MRIIENNFNQENNNRIVCNNCNSIFEYNEDDIEYNKKDLEHYVKCPCCDYDNIIPDKVITVDNVKYPNDYYDFSNGKDWSNEQINEEVKKCILFLIENPDEYFRYISSGNTFICVFNHSEDDEYHVVVSKKHYETYVDKKASEKNSRSQYRRIEIMKKG